MEQYPPPVIDATSNAAFFEPVAEEQRKLEFRFTGNASEYFRIWIVNTLLSIATLGVYSAWAKVRNRQYFYRHTWVDGSCFEYLADPMRILKGRLIMAAALGLLFGSQYYSITLYGVLVGAAVLVTPWVVVKALAFNARNSAYRNVRFSFLGNAGELFGLYLGMAVLHVVTCGLGYPYVQWRLTKFVASRHTYGDEAFAWQTESSEYYKVYLIALAMTLPAYLLFAVGIFALRPEAGAGEGLSTTMTLGMAALYAYLIVPAAFLRARLSNALYGGLWIGKHGFTSAQRPTELLSLYFTNAVAIIFSLGLLIPWAQIRLAQYRASRVLLYATGPIQASAFDLQRHGSAVGEAGVDLGNFDLDLGV